MESTPVRIPIAKTVNLETCSFPGRKQRCVRTGRDHESAPAYGNRSIDAISCICDSCSIGLEGGATYSNRTLLCDRQSSSTAKASGSSKSPSFVAEGGFDSPVFRYVEGRKAFEPCAAGFADYIGAEIDLQEDVHRSLHRRGGYYVTIRDGTISESHPALGEGERPLDHPDRFAD